MVVNPISWQLVQISRDWFFFFFLQQEAHMSARLGQVKKAWRLNGKPFNEVFVSTENQLKNSCQCFNSKWEGPVYLSYYRWLTWVSYVHSAMNVKNSLWWERLNNIWKVSFIPQAYTDYLLGADHTEMTMTWSQIYIVHFGSACNGSCYLRVKL